MELLFIYNAENDVFNGLVDYAHKVFKPSTYKCDLCALTHHNLGQRKAWKQFRAASKANLSFHYIKQFEMEFNETYDYPVVLERQNGQNNVILKSEDLSKINAVEELIERIEDCIKKTVK